MLAVVLIVASNFSAFAYTARQLVDGIDITSPIAYVPFVPLVALLAAAQRWRGTPGEPTRNAQRSADWIVFAGFATAAAVVGHAMPAAFTTETLTWRADLAAVPLVAAAVVVALFGLRMLWRLRTVLWFTTLMSPALYRPLAQPIRTFTSWSTNWAVGLVSNVLPFVSGTEVVPDGRKVTVTSAGKPVTMLVAEVCAGNGAVLAGIFVALSMWLLCSGPTRSKRRWALACVALCWLGNLVRLTALFAASAVMGERAATGWFHELAGMVGLLFALIAALSFAGRMGLEPRTGAVPHQEDRTWLPSIGRSAMVVVAVFTVAMVVVTQAATSGFDPMRGASDAPTASATTVLRDWLSAPPDPGMSIVRSEDVSWAPEFFGAGARWESYLAGTSGLGAVMGIDVISSSDSTRFDTYGLAACFGFHGWRMIVNRVVPAPGDRNVEQIVYRVDGEAAQAQAQTPGAPSRTVAVLSWRQRTAPDRVERITLQQQQPATGEWSFDDLSSLARRLGDELDARRVG